MSWKPEFDGVTFVGVEKYTNQDTPSMCMKTSTFRGKHYVGMDITANETSPSMMQVIPTHWECKGTWVVTPSSLTAYTLGFRQRKALRMMMECLARPNRRFTDQQLETALSKARLEMKGRT